MTQTATAEYATLLIDEPAPQVKRITLNRPEKRNALSNELRRELFAALRGFDRDENTRVTIVRGAGKCFSAGYDLASDLYNNEPYYTASGDGHWSRHVSEGWFTMWDLAKPVIAQVHGYALAGGSELASACDLIYIAEDAKIGYPVTRMLSPPDMQFHPWFMSARSAMETLLTGESFSGIEAVQNGFANRAFPADQLDEAVVNIAKKIAVIASDLTQLNKRSVHRALDIMGVRTAIRAGSELMGLATHQSSVKVLLGDVLTVMKDTNKS